MTKRNSFSMDTEHFISLVKARPAIWRNSSRGQFMRRAESWHEICSILYPSFETFDENKQSILRASTKPVVRHVRSRRKKNYKEADSDLSSVACDSEDGGTFSQRIKFEDGDDGKEKEDSKQTECEVTSVQESGTINRVIASNNDDEEDVALSHLARNGVDSRIKERVTTKENDFCETIDRVMSRENEYSEIVDRVTSRENVSTVTSIVEENRHILFVKSLLPSLNKLNDDETLDFQMSVIKVLQDVRKDGLSNNISSISF